MITTLVIQLVSLPLGRGLARILPDVQIFGHALNPGPFTVKEHVLATVMGSVGDFAYATDIIAVQRVFYNQQWSFFCESKHSLPYCRQKLHFGNKSAIEIDSEDACDEFQFTYSRSCHFCSRLSKNN